jgi:hypothetical protein
MMFAIAATVICLPLFVWRWRSLSAFYRRAITIRGNVSKLQRLGKTVVVYYAFELKGEPHESFASLPARRAGEFSEAMAIDILVDPQRPDSSLIKAQFS